MEAVLSKCFLHLAVLHAMKVPCMTAVLSMPAGLSGSAGHLFVHPILLPLQLTHVCIMFKNPNLLAQPSHAKSLDRSACYRIISTHLSELFHILLGS